MILKIRIAFSRINLAAVLLGLALCFASKPGIAASVNPAASLAAAVEANPIVSPVRCYTRRICDRRGCRSVRRCTRSRSRSRCSVRRVCDRRGCRSVRRCRW
jgi:hypothetical protein